MKVLVASDKFKGSLTSVEVSSFIAKIFEDNGDKVLISPLADGGEGTVDAVLAAVGGQKVDQKVKNPLGKDFNSFWGRINQNKAVIEMAAASGLHLLSLDEHNPFITSTYGTGQLIKAVLDNGIINILIGVGGSATNDGGMGAASALGVRFLDKNLNILQPIGENLINVQSIDLSNIDTRVNEAKIKVAVDVDNPFYGSNGAAYVYGPQKGASEDQIKFLDEGLMHFSMIVKLSLGVDLQSILGSGAAGGLAGGLVALLGAELVYGTKYICDLLKLEEKVKEADIVITGEGQVDEQTMHGKAPTGVINLAHKHNKPIYLIAGQLGEGYEKIEDSGVKVFSLSTNEKEAKENIVNPRPALKNIVEKIIKSLND